MAKSREARTKFVGSQISQQIAAQIRALRRRDDLSQPKLAEKIGTTQNQIYRLEKPRTSKPRLSTLKRLAEAFDVALVVRFVPFSQFAAWFSSTPFVDKGLSTVALYVPSFEQEQKERSSDVRIEDVKEINIPMPERFTNEPTNIVEFHKAMAGTGTQTQTNQSQSNSRDQQFAMAVGG